MFHKLKNVLIVEDAPDQRALLLMYLKGLGLSIFEATDGLEATRILESHDVDLLITDFNMPNMDGATLLQWCRSRFLDIPVIFLSSEAHLFEEEDLALKDCCSILIRSKPFSLALLAAAVRAADRHRHQDDCAFKSFKAAVSEELFTNAGSEGLSDPV